MATPDGKTLITSGGDKKIRVWDVTSKKHTGMLLGQIGPGLNGSIQAIAISPDGKHVVSLAWMYPGDSFEALDRETDVRVFELATGNLQSGFRFPGTLQDLDFSPDGRYLTIVGNPKADTRCGYVYIYDTKKIMKGFGQIPAPLASDMLYGDGALLPSYVGFVPEKKGKAAESRIVVANWLHNWGG